MLHLLIRLRTPRKRPVDIRIERRAPVTRPVDHIDRVAFLHKIRRPSRTPIRRAHPVCPLAAAAMHHYDRIRMLQLRRHHVFDIHLLAVDDRTARQFRAFHADPEIAPLRQIQRKRIFSTGGLRRKFAHDGEGPGGCGREIPPCDPCSFPMDCRLTCTCYRVLDSSSRCCIAFSSSPFSRLAFLSAQKIVVDTTLVVIPVTVTDPTNRFVLGLDKEDFSIFEDGVEQKITHFSGEDAPLSVGILIDTSGSMDLKMETSRRAVTEFLKTMNAQDEAFLIQFSDQAQVVQEFTGSMSEIENRMSSLRPGGLTALLDAVDLGVREMKKAKNPRKALVVVSDGGDNHSRYTAADIKDVVTRSGHANIRDGRFRAHALARIVDRGSLRSAPARADCRSDRRPRIRSF